MKKVIIFIIILIILVIYLLSSVQGKILGLITDKNKNPIQGSKITITSIANPTAKYELRSDKKGKFVQIGLYPGYYQIKCEKEGFITGILEIRVPINETVEVNLELETAREYGEKKETPSEKSFKQANEAFQKGDYEKAVNEYREALKEDPNEPIYYYNLGISYRKMNKNDEAIEAFKKMIEIQPQSFSGLKNLGELYGLKKDFEEASKYFKKAVEISPNDPEAYYNLGACLMNNADYKGALEAFKKSIEVQSDYGASYYQLGLLYVNQSMMEEAIKAFEKFIQLSPDDPNVPTAKQMLEYLKKNN
ncbi:MAG: tetratricopeptide repeat protein [Acidobacteriota bacterium]